MGDIVTITVSPEGNDAAAGTPEAPVKSLERAAALAREALRTGGRLSVHLRGGCYRMEQSLVLGPEDSGTADAPVLWRNAPGERPLLSAARPVVGWGRLSEVLPGAPEASRGHLWAADLPEARAGRWRFSALFDRHGLLPRAATAKMKTRKGAAATCSRLYADPSGLAAGSSTPDAELLVTPSHNWLNNYLPIAACDEAAGVIRTGIPGTYPLDTGREELFYRIENTPHGLGKPGSWLLDTVRGRVVLWPRDDQEPRGILAPVLTELIRVEGDEDARRWASHIVFEGITFSHTDRMRWPQDRQAAQHDWELYDFPNAAMRLRGAEHITVRRCSFLNGGGSAIRLDRHAVDNVVANNDIADLGGAGIVCIGHGPGARDGNRHNQVVANHIQRVGCLWWHSVGIFLCQSGHNLVRDNLVHNLPYAGIVLVSGREAVFGSGHHPEAAPGADGGGDIDWDVIRRAPDAWFHRLGFLHCKGNVVEHNEIHHAMELLHDGNGIYLSGTGVGNIVRRNYVHDIEGPGTHSGIRLDDLQWYTEVTENVVWRINGGGITLKDINEVTNNIVCDCRRHGSLLVRRKGSFGGALRRNILVQLDGTAGEGSPFGPFYSPGGLGGRLEEPMIDDNWLHCVASPGAALACLAAMRGLGKDLHSRTGDPGFADAASGDFRLRPDAPVLRTGFRPFDDWGLTQPAGAGGGG